MLRLILLAVLLAGCTLGSNTTPQPERTQAVDVTEEVTEEATQDLTKIAQVATGTPTATKTPTPTPTRTPTPTATRVVINCIPRQGWLVYTVQAGDTLSSIARRVGSTSAELSAANCLSNPNAITTNQLLRVPRLPPVTTNRTIGQVTVSPVAYITGSVYVVRPNQVLNLRWPEAPTQPGRIEFTYVGPQGQNVLIGTDDYTPDGAQLNWALSPDQSVQIRATARLNDGSIWQTANAITVLAQAGDRVQGNISIVPDPLFESGYDVLNSGQSYHLTWNQAPITETSQVEFTLISGDQLLSLGIDSNLSDGASINWTVPEQSWQGQLVASARVFGQSGSTVRSQPRNIITRVNGPANRGQVSISPVLRTEGGWLVLSTGATVTLSWPEVDESLPGRVEFYITPTGTGTADARTLLGTDTTTSDGASIQWTVPDSIGGHVSARVFLENGTSYETASDVQIYSEVEQQGPVGEVTIAPNTGFDGTTYTLERNAIVTVTWPEAPADAQRVEFYYHVEIPGLEQTVLIDTDSNPGDGAQASWHIPGGVQGRVEARAFLSSGQTVISGDVRVYAEII
ncbi:MAG: LysM peptidoglycan-binding domain-containing protein [Anaerolineae bacterium]|nr:LysM peptidoglycan-binding domain-containing protein [Anaerolineae bacterium]